MNKGDFVSQLAAMVQGGVLPTRRAEMVVQTVVDAGVTDPEALGAIVKALAADQLSDDDLRVLGERAPRFVETLRAGLRPLLGPVTEARLTSLARHGHITASVMDRALSHMQQAKVA